MKENESAAYVFSGHIVTGSPGAINALSIKMVRLDALEQLVSRVSGYPSIILMQEEL